MVEVIIVGLILIVLIYYLIHTWIGSCIKEGDYVVWFGGLYKVIKVEGEFIIIEDHTPLKWFI